MAYQIAYDRCFGCGRTFGFNPDLVPSIPIDPATGAVAAGGVNRPICGMCVQRANPIRVADGLAPIEVRPGAYEPGEV